MQNVLNLIGLAILPLIQALNEIASKSQCQFVSFTYVSKETGEKARHTVRVGQSFTKAYEADLLALRLQPNPPKSEPVKRQAKAEVMRSLRKSLSYGIGSNPDYTRINSDIKAGIFTICRKGEHLNLKCFKHSKIVLEKGTFKEVKSRPLTVEKNKLKEGLKTSDIREFILKQVSVAKINGDTLELE